MKSEYVSLKIIMLDYSDVAKFYEAPRYNFIGGPISIA